MLGENKLKDFKFEKKLKGYAIKEPVFSFDKFPGVNKELGPEMKSTGEAIRFIKDLRDPYFRQLYKDRSMYLSNKYGDWIWEYSVRVFTFKLPTPCPYFHQASTSPFRMAYITSPTRDFTFNFSKSGCGIHRPFADLRTFLRQYLCR